jgi:ATP-dependent Lon protease
VRYITAPDGSHHVIAQGEARFRVKEYVQVEPYLVARIERIEEPDTEHDSAIEARTVNLKAQAHQALALLPQKPEDLDQAIENATSPSGLTDLVATFMDIPVKEKQELLETFELVPRMDKVSEKLAHLVEVLTLSHELRQKTQGKMEKAQREYFLREQLRQIEKELGEGQTVEVQDLGAAIEKSKMPPETKKEARRELTRLQRMPEAAAEYGMLRGYLEALVELPWQKNTKDKIDIAEAKKILDEDHFGLEKIKRRILEFLAVKKLAPTGKSPILCFVGPPGVGKTSLGRSIARAMGRKFVRMSLGGVHDESEIRGHRRTYVGAMPGSVMQHLRKCGSSNPVFMLDEMDKLGRSMHGDPSSALLEVLDPEQNKRFTDHYLNVPFDLSRVLFVATANVLDAIPGPLRDRCEVIELAGYTQEEKLEIAKRYLVARQREANGLTEKQLTLTDAALLELIRSYTREAGCRNLEREIGSLARHAATKIAADEAKAVTLDAPDLRAVLGPVRFENELALRTGQPGVATGLAWTPVGGEILFIEATKMPGRGELILTGQLGDVMKESARAAISLVKTNATALGIDPAVFEKSDIHVHVPAGAIPKDGPSAGVAMTTALVSLLTSKPVKSDLAMTGEISLRGLVLPVGGIKEKVLAARRAGIKTVCLPARNEKDHDDIPEETRKALRFVWTSQIDQVLREALGLTHVSLTAAPEPPAGTARISASP